MRRVVLITFSLVFVLFVSIFSGSSISENMEIENENQLTEPEEEDWWDNWIRDLDHNGIDDVLDDMIASNPETERTKIFVDYSSHPSEEDISSLSKYDLDIKYVYNIIPTICARNVLLGNIEKISHLPKVVMVEYEDDLVSHLNVSAQAVKAGISEYYSPETVHDLGFLGRDISIAILDSGVDDGGLLPNQGHTSLDDLDDDPETDDPKFIAGVDTTHVAYISDGSYNPTDSDVIGHGTHVAGIAMGTGGGSEYIGVAPQARLVDVKVMEKWGSGNMGEFILGVEWCVEYKDEFNIRVMSMSVGGNYNSNGSDAGSQAVNVAWDEGIIGVTSIGNGGTNTIGPPASADNVIAIGAIDDRSTVNRSDDTIWGSSNRGPRWDDGDEDHLDELKPDVVAPGVNIMSAKSGTPGAYIEYDGTSMACPHVAGIVALMLEANPNLTPDMVRQILQDTAEMPENISPSTEYDDVYHYNWGWGKVDAYLAVIKALEYDDRPPIISDIEIEVNGLTATISWHTHKAANTIIEYGPSEDQLDDVYEDLDNYVWEHSVIINRYMGKDLEEDTEYFFKITCWDEKGYGPGESDILSFKTAVLPDTEPPWIIDVKSNVFDTSATILWKTNEFADSVVEYGLTPDYGLKEDDLTPRKNHTITLTELMPVTTYYFRVNSTDGSGNNNHSVNYIFTTKEEPDTIPPIIYSVEASGITDTSATITWATNEPCSSLVRYGKTTLYVNSQGDEEPKFEHEIKLTGLEESTLYHYQVESKDDSPNHNSNTTGDFTFQTTEPIDDILPSLKSDPKVTILTDTSATIEWETDEASEGWVEYGFTKNYGYKEPKNPSGNFVFVHNITLTDLSPASTYHFMAVFTDEAGNQNESDDYSFSTLPPIDNTPPDLISGPNLIFVGETTATIVWVTDELSDSEVYYGTTTSYGSQITNTELSIDHEITLTDLTSGTTYHYMVKSTDSSGNYVESTDYFFDTKDISIPINIEFLNLVNGQLVSGIIEIDISVSAGPNIIEWVRYRVDNETWIELEDSYTIIIDTKDYSEGEHTLYVEASDGRTTKTEQLTFEIEHEPEVDEDIWVWVVLFVIIAVVIILVLAAVYRSVTRKGIQTQPVFTESKPSQEVFIETDVFSTTEAEGISFVPDEQEPEILDEPEAGISFVPDAPILGEEPDISFVPDREEISFNVFEEEPIFIPSKIDTVRCPRCKISFDTDISSKIECPECGFSADLRG